MKENRRHHSGHGRHHHRHHSRLKHRFKRWLRRHKLAGVTSVLSIILILAIVVWMHQDVRNRAAYNVFPARQVDVASYRSIQYNGKAYHYNNRITSILYVGIDSENDILSKSTFTSAPRADSISLVVMDELHESITIIALNRDTMTEIRRYTLGGKSRGLFTDHLGYAFTYGDGGQASCENLCEAVSNLLYGIPIDGYVVSNRSSIPIIGGEIGPVEVVVPNDDLRAFGFEAGRTAIIDSTNLETFVRSRDTADDLSNVGRMERQQAYIDGAMERILALLTENPVAAWETVEEAEGCVLTNITRSRYLDLARILKHVRYSSGDYFTPQGEQVVGQDHDEFYPDRELLKEKVVELFYIE